MSPTPTSFSVATYNILADAYIKPVYFPNCSPASLNLTLRHPLLVQRIIGLNADAVCLQEVEQSTFEYLTKKLSPIGYRGKWAKKSQGKPDGCAVFIKAPWAISDSHILHYTDGSATRVPSGHVALFVTAKHGDTSFLVVATHFKWFDEQTPREQRYGETQAAELLKALSEQTLPTLVCGDFNVDPRSGILDNFRAHGFLDAHSDQVMTFNQDCQPRKIDFIMYRGPHVAHASPTAEINGAAILPSEVEPSDHLPLLATFTLP